MRTIATAVKHSTTEIVAWFEVINNAPPTPRYCFFLHVHCILLPANLDFFFFCLDTVKQKGKG